MTSIDNQSPYDPELDVVLQKLVSAGITNSVTLETISMQRKKLFGMRVSDDELHRAGKIDVQEQKVPGPVDAPEISLLICRSSASAKTKATSLLPCIYYMHGGGMIAGDNRFGIQFLLDWILEFNIIVVSVEYRLAPEYPHPAPSEDCYAGLLWIAAHAQGLGVDRSQLTVAGGSAGGGLAAAVALMVRDRGGPKLQGQLLICPMLDDRDQTLSTRQFESIGTWNRQSNITGWTALLGNQKNAPDVSPYAAPSRAQDLSNLPPAFIYVASTEIFRDEDIDYAQRIWEVGGIAELHVWSGGFHGFALIAPQATVSKQALEATTSWYRRLLASHKK